jgi:hypothetical protein
MSQNNLLSIAGLGSLTNLTVLDLSHNKLDFISDDFVSLSNLKSLNLSYNHLTSRGIPPAIYQMKLSVFKANSNQLTRMCTEFQTFLLAIEMINVDDNPWVDAELYILVGQAEQTGQKKILKKWKGAEEGNGSYMAKSQELSKEKETIKEKELIKKNELIKEKEVIKEKELKPIGGISGFIRMLSRHTKLEPEIETSSTEPVHLGQIKLSPEKSNKEHADVEEEILELPSRTAEPLKQFNRARVPPRKALPISEESPVRASRDDISGPGVEEEILELPSRTAEPLKQFNRARVPPRKALPISEESPVRASRDDISGPGPGGNGLLIRFERTTRVE